MSWIDELNSAPDVGMSYRFQPQQPKQPKKKGNLLTALLPTATSIGGGAAGAAIGTALLPGIGTLIGAGLGSALGGGGGKVAENAIEGNKLSSGVAGEAALSGVLGAGPLRLGKAAIDTVKGVKAGTGIAEALAQGGKAGVDMNLTKAVGNKLSKSGQGLIAKEFRLSPTQQSNFAKLHGEEATSVLRRYGVKSPEDVRTKLQPLQDAFDNTVSSIPAIGKTELEAGLKKVYEPLSKSPALFEQGLGSQIKQQADELLKLAKKGSIPADKVNELRKTFDSAVSYTQKGAPEYNVIKKTADALRGTLHSAADKAGVKTADGMSFKDVGKELRKLYGLDDIVGKQSYLGSGSLPLSLGNTPGTVIGSAGGPLGAAAGYAGNALVNSSAGRRALATGALKAGEKITAKAAKSNPYGIKPIATRVGSVGLADALAGQLSPNNMAQPATTTTTSTNMPITSNMIDSSYQNGADMSTRNDPFDVGNITENVKKLAASGANTKTIESYLSIASAIQSMQADAAKSGGSLNSTQLQQANNAQSGLDSLTTIADAIGNNPNAPKLAALPGGSFTRSATGTGPYQAAIANATDVIGRLRSGGAINQDEEKRFRSLLPGSFDDQQTINYKLNSLAQLFQRFSNPQAAQPDAASLASALRM